MMISGLKWGGHNSFYWKTIYQVGGERNKDITSFVGVLCSKNPKKVPLEAIILAASHTHISYGAEIYPFSRAPCTRD